MRLLKEVGALGNPDPTYQLSDANKVDIINNNMTLCDRYGLTLEEHQKTLPIMYWTPKMHYIPSRARFIVSSAKCSTKPLSRAVSNTFKCFCNQIRSFHDKSKFYKNYNRFWIIDKLNVINTRKRAKEISTFDFSTLYTKLPHNDLIRVLNSIIDFCFDWGNRNYLGFSKFSTFWRKKPSGKQYFSKSKLKALVKHLITNTFFEVGNILLHQSIGIPMGIDPAPFWANLYLYFYENDFVTKLISTDKVRARRFLHAFRFIDDQSNLNDSSEFSKSYSDIYPPELQLKCGRNRILKFEILIIEKDSPSWR